MRFLMAILLAGMLVQGAAAEEPAERLMTVTGVGRVSVAPDMATVRLGVVTQAKGAREAIDDNSRAMAGVLERLRGLGIEDRDLQTADFSVSPRWARSSSGQEAQITGFVARNLLMVRVRDLGGLGEVLDAVARDGANAFENIAFGLQNPGPTEARARRSAVAEARKKAALFAEAAGVTLGPLIRLSEAGGIQPQPMLMERAEMAMASDAVPVAGGELDVTARVTLVYAMEGGE